MEKPNSKQRRKLFKWDNRTCKSPISRVYAGKTLTLDYTRKICDHRTVQQRSSALSENPLVAEYTRVNLEIGLYAQKSEKRRTIQQNNSAISKHPRSSAV